MPCKQSPINIFKAIVELKEGCFWSVLKVLMFGLNVLLRLNFLDPVFLVSQLNLWSNEESL